MTEGILVTSYVYGQDGKKRTSGFVINNATVRKTLLVILQNDRSRFSFIERNYLYSMNKIDNRGKGGSDEARKMQRKVERRCSRRNKNFK